MVLVSLKTAKMNITFPVRYFIKKIAVTPGIAWDELKLFKKI